ncbi:MAG: hypothetical protein NTY90_03800 [Candidatus Micrarchaeota archaeon]|nr:hypothetical protein [Candidatus Micrarchaeota archaeon]
MELSFEALRRIQLQEKHNATLTIVDDVFYDAYASFLSQQADRLRQNFSLDEVRVYENTQKILHEIIEKRQQKILLKAFRDLRTGEVTSEGLAKQERELYIELLKLLQSHEAALNSAFAGEKSMQEKTAEKEKDAVTVKILVDLPAFVWTDSQQVGPFSASQVVELRREEAELLIKRNAAEAVQKTA